MFFNFKSASNLTYYLFLIFLCKLINVNHVNKKIKTLIWETNLFILFTVEILEMR